MGISFNLIGVVFNQGSTFAFNIIAANLLGRRTFGEFAMIQTTILTVSQIAQLGCGVTSTRYVAEFRSTNKRRAGRILALLRRFSFLAGAVSAVALLMCTPWLADSFLKASDLKVGLAIGAGVILFSALNGLLMGALAGLEAYRKLAKALVISGIAYLIACTAFAWAAGLNGAVAGLLVSALVQWILLQRALNSECIQQGIQVCSEGFNAERAVLSRFALPAAVSGLSSLPALWFASAFLARRADGYVQLALYGAAYTLMTAVLFLPNITNTVGLSLLNHYRGQDEGDDYQRTFWINFAIVAGIVVTGASLLSFLGSGLLRLFGKDFTDGYSVLLIMMAATVPQGLGGVTYQLIYSRERMWISFFAVALPRDAMLVSLAYFLIPHYGAIGLAAAYAMASTMALVAIIIIVSRTGFRTPVAYATVDVD